MYSKSINIAPLLLEVRYNNTEKETNTVSCISERESWSWWLQAFLFQWVNAKPNCWNNAVCTCRTRSRPRVVERRQGQPEIGWVDGWRDHHYLKEVRSSLVQTEGEICNWKHCECRIVITELLMWLCPVCLTAEPRSVWSQSSCMAEIPQ